MTSPTPTPLRRLPRRRALLGAALVLAAAWAAVWAPSLHPAIAQETPVEAEIDIRRPTIDPPSVVLGERTWLTIAVRHGEELLISASAPRPVAGLELIEAPPPVTEAVEGALVTTFRYALAAFTLDEVQPGAVRVSWLREDGSAGSRQVQSPVLIVRSTIGEGDPALRPLKPQLIVSGAPPAWARPGVAVVVAAMALAVVVSWLVVRRRGRPPPAAVTAAPSETAERHARQQLDALADRQLQGPDDFEGYYETVSLAVRGYLEDRFGFRATALTTGELEARMTDHGVERWQARLVRELLDRCDAAVYARVYPDPASADHDLTIAYEIVELSRPRSAVAP